MTVETNKLANAYADGSIFTAFDLETTGLDPKLDRIVEIGAVKFDSRGIIARYSTFVDPQIPMPAEAGEINKITDEMLAGQPLIDEALPDFLFFIKNTIIIAHNAPFDCGFINESLARFHSEGRTELSSLPNTIADTRLLAKEAFPKLASYSLQKIAADLNIPALNAHRAEDDARLCMEIFLRTCGTTVLGKVLKRGF